MINNISTTRAGLVVQSTRTTQQHARHGFDPQIDRAAIPVGLTILLWGEIN